MEREQKIPLPKISSPANRELQNAGYTHLAQLTEVAEAELLSMHGVGPKAIRILNEALAKQGLTMAKK